MTASREKPGVAVWVTVAVVVALIAYPLSYSPACRLADWEVLPRERTHEFYGPLLAVIARSPESVRRLAINYAGLFAEEPVYTHGVWWIVSDQQWRISKH
jgi:hypothetical protein